MNSVVDVIISFIPLLFMEILLGIDNVIFISIVLSRLSGMQNRSASRIWMIAGISMRMALLIVLMYLVGIEKELLKWERWNYSLSIKDLILFVGGMFLLVNSTLEIHNKLEGANEKGKKASKNLRKGFTSIILQMMAIDFVFSIDGVITALGMAKHILPMFLAIACSMAIMFIYAPRISTFIERHPTFKILALSFLVLIAVLLIVEGIHIEKIHIPKGYIYFAMAFSFSVEVLNLRLRRKTHPVELRKDKPEE